MDFLKFVTFCFIYIWKFVNWIRPSKQLLYPADRNHLSPQLLTDLPPEIIKLILDELPIKDRIKIRNVCHCLRRVADNHIIQCESIMLRLFTNWAHMYLDNEIAYLRFADLSSLSGDKASHIKFVFQKLKSMLKNPKLQLYYLDFEIIWYPEDEHEHKFDEIIQPAIDDLEKFLSCLPHQVSTKNLYVNHRSVDVLHQLLPYFKPETLYLIYMGDFTSKHDEERKQEMYEEISKMEQCNKALIGMDC